MTSPRLLALLALLPLGVACQTALASSAGARPDHVSSADFLPPAKSPLQVHVGDAKADTLDTLLNALSDSTGVEFTIDEATRNDLRARSTGLAKDITVPAEEAWRWVEGLLVHNGFQLGALSLRPPFLVGVYNAIPRGNQIARPRPIQVASADLDVCVEHPAFLYTSLLDLPHVDVRQLGNSLRALTNDMTGTLGLIPVGNTNSILVTGQGTQVSDLAALLLEIERNGREMVERASSGSGDGTPAGAPGS